VRIRYLLLTAYGMGGTVRTVLNQAGAMAAAGHEVEVVSVLRRRKTAHFAIDSRIRTRTLVDEVSEPPRDGKLLQRRARHIPRGERGIRYFNRTVEKAIVTYLAGLSDGVLVTTRPALNLLAARHVASSVVRVAQEHMNFASHRPDVQKAITRWYPRLDAVVVLTHTDQADYERLLPGTRVVRIPNAVRSLDQEPSEQTNKIVIAAGRLVPQKGFDLLIPAFAKVAAARPDWQLRIFGSGAREADLRQLIEELHMYNNVYLMGRTDRMDDELAKASIAVLSSRFEGLPMILIEAMTHAVPVVAFDCPTGPGDVVDDGVDGLLVPPEDTDALAAALLRLIDDPPLRRKMASAALRTAAAYSPDSVNPRWESLFTELPADAG
jgi:glycosyltransferase involved in cell wall biosynthesis